MVKAFTLTPGRNIYYSYSAKYNNKGHNLNSNKTSYKIKKTNLLELRNSTSYRKGEGQVH